MWPCFFLVACAFVWLLLLFRIGDMMHWLLALPCAFESRGDAVPDDDNAFEGGVRFDFNDTPKGKRMKVRATLLAQTQAFWSVRMRAITPWTLRACLARSGTCCTCFFGVLQFSL